MAALWLHTASLLVLLVISCPGSQAIASQYMCGSHLVDALNLVCGDRGFYYLPLSRVNPAPGQHQSNLLSTDLILQLHISSFSSSSSNSSLSVGREGFTTRQHFSIMAALWLHTASLLVLLVITCPSSQASSAQYLCGSHLVDALYLVCGDRGFFFTPRTPAERVGGGNDQVKTTVKRSIMDDCCSRPCNIFDLQQYCITVSLKSCGSFKLSQCEQTVSQESMRITQLRLKNGVQLVFALTLNYWVSRTGINKPRVTAMYQQKDEEE
ncbi:hypothetical protein INR49_002555, partial [Caranx melampygus]